MAVFRIEKTKDYTVMSNHHLRNTSLSLKAKGLLSLMLSLPEEWDYTTKGLAYICKDGVDSISAGIRELEAQGYLRRERIRNANGQLGSIEYTILEQPVPPEPVQESPILASPERENPEQAEPVLEEPRQLNIDKSNTEKSKNELSNTDSIPSPSSPLPAKHREHSREAKRKEAILSEMEEYRDLVKQNILLAVEDRDLTNAYASTLLKSGKPLDDVFQIYDGRVTDHMDHVFDCLEECAAGIIQKENLRNTPLYMNTGAYAREHGELEQFRASHKANIACKGAIEEAIRQNHDGSHLDRTAAKQVLDEYGADRTMFVLAVTARDKD